MPVFMKCVCLLVSCLVIFAGTPAHSSCDALMPGSEGYRSSSAPPL